MNLSILLVVFAFRFLVGEVLPNAILKDGPVLGYPEPPLPTDPNSANSHSGSVTAVERRSITIATSSKIIFRIHHQNEDPIPYMVPRIELPRLPRRFVVIEPLALGGVAYHRLGYPDGYRLSDVRVGDLIFFDSYSVNGQEMCRSIEIIRRPGGKVPPVPGDRAQSPYSHHEKMQAYQDNEEFGTPIPELYLPVWLQKPTAPEPRVYIKPIPPAKP